MYLYCTSTISLEEHLTCRLGHDANVNAGASATAAISNNTERQHNSHQPLMIDELDIRQTLMASRLTR